MEIASIAIGLLVAMGGGVWGIIQALLSKDRKHIDDKQAASDAHFTELFNSLEAKHRESRTVMWKKIDDLRDGLDRLKVENAELKGHVNNLPSAEFMSQGLLNLEGRLEKRIESLSGQIQDLATSLISRGAK